MEAQLLAEIVSGVAGLLGIIVGVIFLIRVKRRRKDWTRSFSEWKPMGRKKATVELPSSYSEKPFPVSVTQVRAQTTSPEMPSYNPTPKTKITKLTLDRYKLESETKLENVYKYVALPNLKRGTSLGSIQNDLYGEERTSSDSSNEEPGGLASPSVDQFDEACGANTPDSLPEQWSTPTYATTIEFTVTYVNSSNALAIHVRRLINLPNWKPFKSSNSHRIKMKLIDLNEANSPLSLEPEPTSKKSSAVKRWGSQSAIPAAGATANKSVKCVIKKTFDIAKGAFFAFSGYSLNDLKNLSLFIYLYELKYKNLREKLIAECKCALSQLELVPGTSVTCMEELKLKKKNGSSKEKARGQLLLSLYYQTDANRMKVLIRKATDLPKKKLLSIGAEYGVLVNVIYGGQITSTQETKKIHSRTPVWNQPLIFDIPEKNLEKYSLQFITFCSGGVSQPHHFIGHVVIGPDVRGSGHDHWMEATHPKSVESTCWHKLQHLQ